MHLGLRGTERYDLKSVMELVQFVLRLARQRPIHRQWLQFNSDLLLVGVSNDDGKRQEHPWSSGKIAQHQKISSHRQRS